MTRRVGHGGGRQRTGAIRATLAASVVALLAGAFAGPRGSDAQTEVRLDIQASGEIRMKIALEPFTAAAGAGGMAKEFEDVVVSDLERSGRFTLVRGPEQLALADTLSSVFFVPIQAVVTAEIRNRGKGWSAEGALADYPGRQKIFADSYPFDKATVRRAAHRFSDEIVLRLTGEKGIAQTRIAYTSTAGKSKEIFMMDYDGGNPTQVTRDATIDISPAWSPDGREVAFTSYRKGNPDLLAMTPDGKKTWVLSSARGLNISPSYAADGSRIAFTLSREGNSEIYVADRDGKNLRRLTNHRAIDSSPTWAPSGLEIAFTSDRSGTPQVFVMSADGADVRRLTYQGSWNDSPAWSPRGDLIAYVSRNGTFALHVMKADGSDDRVLLADGGSHENPRWSPDGRHIVFSSSRGGKRDLWCIDVDGANLRRLTSSPGDHYSPAWSPPLDSGDSSN